MATLGCRLAAATHPGPALLPDFYVGNAKVIIHHLVSKQTQGEAHPPRVTLDTSIANITQLLHPNHCLKFSSSLHGITIPF